MHVYISNAPSPPSCVLRSHIRVLFYGMPFYWVEEKIFSIYYLYQFILILFLSVINILLFSLIKMLRTDFFSILQPLFFHFIIQFLLFIQLFVFVFLFFHGTESRAYKRSISIWALRVSLKWHKFYISQYSLEKVLRERRNKKWINLRMYVT